MYVWGRLAWMAAMSKRRGPYRLGDESRLSFRCLPHDIDRNMHLNNARYMMLADVGRIDIFLRSGFWALCSRNGWGPMMGGLQSAYVREIKLWKRFEIVSTIETWTDRQMIGRHRFLLEDGRTAAMILTCATLPMFLLTPWLLHRGHGFTLSVAAGLGLTAVCFAVTALVARRFGVMLVG